MDILTFLSRIIDSLAWPATVAIVIILVRKQLPEIARSLKSIKYKDFEMNFEKEVKEAAAEVRQALSEWEIAAKPDIKIDSASSQHTITVAHYSPSAAILEAWLKVESAAADFAAKLNPNSVLRYPSPLKLKEQLISAGIFDKRQADAFDSLRKVRNQVVHVLNVKFSDDTVTEYLESAEAMAQYISMQASKYS
ncbi:hypothetical protein [Undibacterium squillarum]|uniref:hypothetical protein n=1 Tax=Undibacterium squillarum TaxID=1131567 RepID=UPI0035B4C629